MRKTILITGASKGIGAALACVSAKQGFNIVINYHNSETEAKNLKTLLEEKYSVKVLAIKADVTQEAEVKYLIDKTVEELGKIDILVNNAALAIDNPFKDKTISEFVKVLEVNVGGPFLVTKYASFYMKKGVILNISSTDAVDTFNELSMDYCASKSALNNLTKTFALALPEIKVIAVMLPWTNTEAIKEMDPIYLKKELKRIGQKRLIEPSEVALKLFDIIQDGKLESGKILKVEL